MGRGGRAQTTIDFAIAMGVFLVALTTVIAFMPTLTQPYVGGQENPLVADRFAAQLVDGTLGDPASPSTLNATCTEFFFNGSSSPADPCPSFEPGNSLTSKLGAGSNVFVNVTVQQIPSGGNDMVVVCSEGPGVKDLEERGSCTASPNYVLQEGPAPPNAAGSVTIARRSADLNGEFVFVVVKVWT